MDRDGSILTFADRVRVRTTSATQAVGIAGAIGQVMGETTPSVTGVEVIGMPKRDYAIAVVIEGREGVMWIDPDLFEFLDHSAGTTIALHGGPAMRRDADGEWKPVGLLGRIQEWFRRHR